MPETFRPQLATLVGAAPDGDEWLHEIKYDGYRLIALKRGRAPADVCLLTRSGQNWTERFPTVRDAVAQLAVERAILDGEVVVLRSDGVSSFQALQNSLKAHGTATHVYFCFDLPYCGDHDLSGVPLLARKTFLARLLAIGGGAGPIRYSDHIAGRGPAFHRSACEHELEGVVSKRADARYEARRTKTWVKVKCVRRQEFVIGGWSPPEGSREHFGSLLIGVYEAGELVYAGKVGTGFSQRSLRDVSRRLAEIETDRPPFSNPPAGREARGVHWARPSLVAEIAFTEWTSDGILRHPVFSGLREDRDPKTVRRERAVDAAGESTMSRRTEREVNKAPATASTARRAKKPSASRTKRASRARVARAPAARGAANEAPVSPPSDRTGNASRRARASSKPSTPTAPGPGVVREMAVSHGTQPGRTVATRSRQNAGAPIEVAGVRMTHPDRVLYPQDGITKRDVAEYYVAVADWILPHLVARPLTLLRCPEGVDHQCFYQRHVHESTGPPIRDVPVEEESGETRYYLAVDGLRGLLTLVQVKALELHAWGARADRIDRPDRIVLDLDPGPDVEWSRVVAAAHTVRDRLEQLGLRSFARTTGGKGLHVVMPIQPRSTWDDAKQFARLLAGEVARDDPGGFVLTASKAKRTGRIYLDYLRNARAASAIVSYSTRARGGAPVATPVRWDELTPSLDPRSLNLRTVPRRLRTQRVDPWEEFFDVRQTLSGALRALSRSAH